MVSELSLLNSFLIYGLSHILGCNQYKFVTAPIAMNHIGGQISVKLTRENFLSWKTQLLLLLNYYGLTHILEQDLPSSTKPGPNGILVNP